MGQVLEALFSQAFLPHSICLVQDTGLIWLHAVTDAVTTLAYYSIPFALLYFVYRRTDLTFRWVFVLFGTFILLCGTTHAFGLLTLWYPVYWAEGVTKALTAIVSIGTAAVLWLLIPRALALPSPTQLTRLNEALEAQVAERRAAEQEVRAINAELERRVYERTAALEELNATLRAEVARRSRTEEELRQAKENADHANRAKSRFLAAASHDLRQPVQSLLLLQTALARRVEGHKAEDLVENMAVALDALHSLLDSLLDISKLDAGVITPQPASFPLQKLLGRLEDEFAPRMAEKGLRFRVVPTRSWVHSDPALLERILRNLLENALKYTKEGGIVLGCRRRQDRLQIQVADTGPGIPEEHFREIFQEFVQVGNAERDRRQGLGLGLAIVRRLAHLLEHPVCVHSRIGRGSLFAVEVPTAAIEAEDSLSLASTPALADSQGVVVVIDDEVLILCGMRALLEDWGWTVIDAPSSEEALRRLDRARCAPDIILADYRLRDGKTGADAIRDIQTVYGNHIPAVVLTGDTGPERIAEAERAGFRILHKPVDTDSLRTVLATSPQKAAE